MIPHSIPFVFRSASKIQRALATLFALGVITQMTNAQTPAPDPRDDASPWAMGTSGESMRDFPKFNPLLANAGVKWVRQWSEWSGVQPKQGQWNWDFDDKIVADAKANHLHVLPIWAFFAPWASADGGTRRGPIKDMQFWSDYVSASVDRYHKDIKYWEVWNEFNGSFYDGPDKPKAYADLTCAAYTAAKKSDPTAMIGMSVANFDVGFLDAAIKAGAADHFDFICVHPYENLGALDDGGEMGYLSLASNLRQMLKANHQRENIPLWISEVGFPAPVKPDAAADAKQADILVKGHLLSIVQGFQRIFWFEARGPSYGQGTDLGLMRDDWSQRPSYGALKTMTSLLGPEPKYLGWLDADKGGYGFLFQGAKEKVLAAWSPPGGSHTLTFDSDVIITDLAGNATKGKSITLTTSPVFVTQLPDAMVSQAIAQVNAPYPWGGSFAHSDTASCKTGAVNQDNGINQVNTGTTAVVNGLTETCIRPNFASGGEGHFVYFRVDPQFVPYGTKHLKITIVARRMAADKPSGMNLTYESSHGYTGTNVWNNLPEGEDWHELSWEVKDASFVGQWGWNFRFDATGAANEFYVREVRVKKLGD